MNQRIVIGAVAVAVLLLLAALVGILPFSLFGAGAYDTGFSMADVNNCETESYLHGCNLYGECWHGNFYYGDGVEELIEVPMNNNPIVTSMEPGADSLAISVYGTMEFPGWLENYWGPQVGKYVVQLKGSDLNTWKTIIDTGAETVDSDYVSLVDARMGPQQYTERTQHWWQGNPYERQVLDPMQFKITGVFSGILRVQHWTKFGSVTGWTDWELMADDYAFLASGVGDVELVDSQVRYVAGEDTVKFEVDTGYSGQTQGGEYQEDGWMLEVFNSGGQRVKQWSINDGQHNGRKAADGSWLDYEIPADAINPGQSRTWSVVLTNTYFEQDDETFFTITAEELEQCPDIKPIHFNQADYELGDDVMITLEGVPNNAGTGEIHGFLVNIMYGKDGADYLPNYHLEYVYASGTTATITVTPAKGDTYLTVEAWAFDAPESTGGLMSETAEASTWIKDEQYEPPAENVWVYIIAIFIALAFIIVAVILPIPAQYKLLIVVFGIAIAIMYIIWDMGLI